METLKIQIAKYLGKTIISVDDQGHFLEVITVEDTVPLLFRKSVLYANF